MKRPLVRHSWKQQDGFRVDECQHCGSTRRWDDGYGRMVFYSKGDNGVMNGPFFFTPSCKRIYFSDKVIMK